MRRKIALITSCAPPTRGAPVTGGGLRTLQLLQTLEGAGHSVTLMIEKAALSKGAKKSWKNNSFVAEDLEQSLASLRPDVVVSEQWALLSHLGDWDGPTVVDLHGSLMLENTYRRGRSELMMDAGAKVAALRRVDLMLVPAPVQLHHFASWATLAGFDPRELPLRLLPLAVEGTPAPRKHGRSPVLKLVYGGARWPWINSSEALSTAADFVAGHSGKIGRAHV